MLILENRFMSFPLDEAVVELQAVSPPLHALISARLGNKATQKAATVSARCLH